MKQKLFAGLAAGVMMLSAVGAVSAAPNERANCVARQAVMGRGVSDVARFPREGGPSLVGTIARANCSLFS